MDEFKVLKRHVVAFQIDYFIIVIGGGGGGGGGGVSVIPNIVRFFTKKWENCICSLVLSPFLEKNNGYIVLPIVRGGGRGRDLLNL